MLACSFLNVNFLSVVSESGTLIFGASVFDHGDNFGTLETPWEAMGAAGRARWGSACVFYRFVDDVGTPF